MDAKHIFFNESGRVRSGWRFTIFLFAFILTTLIILIPLTYVLTYLPIGYTTGSFLHYLLAFGMPFGATLVLGWLCGKYFEDLPFRALGFGLTKNWLKDLFFGLLIGAASICFAALIAYIFGGKSFRLNDGIGTSAILLTLSTSLAIFIAGAAFEEAFFRGYPLQTFSRAGLAIFGTMFTSLFFATMHNANPGANFFTWFNTFLAGIWLAIAYFKTRNLWFPFGVHLAWNWFQGSILGINVSGLQELTKAPLFVSDEFGPAWLTGGDYGLEGGTACTITLIASTLLIWFAPFLKPTEELLAMSSEEKPKAEISHE